MLLAFGEQRFSLLRLVSCFWPPVLVLSLLPPNVGSIASIAYISYLFVVSGELFFGP